MVVEVADKPVAEAEADLVAVPLFQGDDLPPDRAFAAAAGQADFSRFI